MDAAFFWFDNATRQLTFAGAKSSLFVLQPADAEGEMVNGARMGVGYVDTAMDYVAQQRRPHPSGTLVFVTTDGLIDQIGGPKEIAFGKRRMREAICAARRIGRADQRGRARCASDWQGTQRRRDDLTFFCFRAP
jgi:serine phosphatase RsbU (regulator of sigma subunit)